ncbi:MAG: hypothetical protein OXB88_05205 [Bacteriovoracales bacterium]|nr:hypothetical protein [Bacteriovoracales bacterium]
MKWMKALIFFSLFMSYSYAKKEDCVKMGERAQICPGDRVRVPILVHDPKKGELLYQKRYGSRELEILNKIQSLRALQLNPEKAKERKKKIYEKKRMYGAKGRASEYKKRGLPQYVQPLAIPDLVLEKKIDMERKNLDKIQRAGQSLRNGYVPETVSAKVDRVDENGKVYLKYGRGVENNSHFSKEASINTSTIGITSGCTDNGICVGMDSYSRDSIAFRKDKEPKKEKVVAINPISGEITTERKIIPKSLWKRKIIAEKETLSRSSGSIILAQGCVDEDERECVGDDVLIRGKERDESLSIMGIGPTRGKLLMKGEDGDLFFVDRKSPGFGLTSGCIDDDKVCVGEKVYPMDICMKNIGPVEIQAINPHRGNVLLDIGGGVSFLRKLRVGVSSRALGLTSGCLGEDKRICVGDEVKVEKGRPVQGEVVALDPHSRRAVIRGVLGEGSDENYYCSPLKSVSRSKRPLFTHARNLFGLTEDISLGEKETAKDSNEIYDGPRKATTGDDKSDDLREPASGIIQN